MLYPLNPPIPSDYLDGIRDLQIRLIELCFEENDITPETIQRVFTPEVAGWLCENFRKLVGTLKSAIKKIPSESKNEIINIFLYDYSFTNNIKNSEFRFREVGNQDVSQLENWCIIYFEQFKSRVDECITKKDFINKPIWIKNFKQNNLTVKVCPFCDCIYHKGTISIEHFLPKSIYPFLSVHPTNLIPCCEDCNGVKEDIDPLTDAKIGQTPFPYSFHFDGLADIIFDYDKLEFIFINTGKDEKSYNEFIKVMRDGYQLPLRWNNPKFLDQLINMTYMKVAEKLAVEQMYGLNPHTNPEKFLNETLIDFKGRFGRFDQLRLMYTWLLAAIQNDQKNTFENVLRCVDLLQ